MIAAATDGDDDDDSIISTEAIPVLRTQDQDPVAIFLRLLDAQLCNVLILMVRIGLPVFNLESTKKFPERPLHSSKFGLGLVPCQR